jgi:hypothetical protein
MTNDTWLLDHARDVHSQSGEDGILLAVLDKLEGKTGWCVEFGAWDGLHYSNTANLIKDHGYRAVMIEADPIRFRDLQRTYPDADRVHGICAFVGFESTDSLDVLLERTPIPKTFDVLSIDIDGNDYHVWNAVERYRPRCVVIEYNPTIATGLHFVQPKDPSVMQGSSLDALVELGKQKGYELVCVTRFNGIFVRREDFPAFEISDNSISRLRRDVSLVTHIFCGYDGKVFIRGYGKLPWHDIPYAEALLQPLPKFLRSWKENYGPVRKKVFSLYGRARKAVDRRK